MVFIKKLSYSAKSYSPIADRKGFTLIELLIAMLISGIVISSIYTAFRSQQRNYLAQEQVSEMQQNIRAGISLMTNEIRMAGYDPDGDAESEIVTANNNTLAFTLVADNDGYDNDGDNSTDEEGELKTIQYDVYDAYGDGTNDLGRQVGASVSAKRAAVSNIDGLEFYYLMADGSQTTTPADPKDIRAIEISILARANKKDRTFSNQATYTTASGANWGPYNDNYRRRFHTVTVQCRNMGL
ncbi:MAG: prepilin-type N-terminal cleavage/methylation domain-containing protein [Desulfurivibrionaceae bacterium]